MNLIIAYIITMGAAYQFNVLARSIISKRRINEDGSKWISDEQINALNGLPLTTMSICLPLFIALREAFP